MTPHPAKLRREAQWAAVGALVAAPVVFFLFSSPLVERSDLRQVQGSVGIVEQSPWQVRFVLDEQPPPIRYRSRLGRTALLIEGLLESRADTLCLVDAANQAWEISIDGELFISYEYTHARLRGERAIGWTLSAVLLACGLALLHFVRRLPSS